MAFLSIDDADFWGRNLDQLATIMDAGGAKGLDVSFFLLGKSTDNPPYVLPLRMEPGYVLPRHAHDCHRMEIIVQGSLTVGDRVLKPGSVMISEPGELYGPHIAGPEGCITFEIFSDFHGGNRMTVVGPSGELMNFDTASPESARKMVENARQQQMAKCK